MNRVPTGQSAESQREDIATYVMARSDSTLVDQLAVVLSSPPPGGEVQLLAGESYVTSLVKDVLKSQGITINEDVDSGTGQSNKPPRLIAVPKYLDPDGPGRVVFNDTWDRPLIIAQAVDEALQSWPNTAELKLSSGWLWWAMSYRKWRDIANVRDFVFWSLDLARAKGWRYVDEENVFSEFSKSGQLEGLFTVEADLDMAYFPPFDHLEPVSKSRHDRAGEPFALLPDSLLELIKFHWDCYRPNALDEVACRHHDPGPRQSDEYLGYPILPNDALPFLRNLDWWEHQISECQRDDLSGVFEDCWGRVQVYCRARWSGYSDKKLAEKLKMKVGEFRKWKSELHLEHEFGGKQDVGQLYRRCGEKLGIADMAILEDCTRFAIDGKWEELGVTQSVALLEILKAGLAGISWTESYYGNKSEYTGYPKLFGFTKPPGSQLKLLFSSTKSRGKIRYSIKPCVKIVMSAGRTTSPPTS